MLDEARRCQVDLIGGGFKSYHPLSASLLYLTYSHQRYREFKYSLIMKFKLFFAEKNSHSNKTFTFGPKKDKKAFGETKSACVKTWSPILAQFCVSVLSSSFVQLPQMWNTFLSHYLHSFYSFFLISRAQYFSLNEQSLTNAKEKRAFVLSCGFLIALFCR